MSEFYGAIILTLRTPRACSALICAGPRSSLYKDTAFKYFTMTFALTEKKYFTSHLSLKNCIYIFFQKHASDCSPTVVRL